MEMRGQQRRGSVKGRSLHFARQALESPKVRNTFFGAPMMLDPLLRRGWNNEIVGEKYSGSGIVSKKFSGLERNENSKTYPLIYFSFYSTVCINTTCIVSGSRYSSNCATNLRVVDIKENGHLFGGRGLTLTLQNLRHLLPAPLYKDLPADIRSNRGPHPLGPSVVDEGMEHGWIHNSLLQP